MKKILSILISLAMLLSITAGLNLTAYADTVGGSCGPNAYWSLNKETGEFKIYGSGDVTSRPWRENNCELLRSTRTIEISGVNNVSYGSFLYEGSSWKSFPVNKIIVGKGVKTIEGVAFSGLEWVRDICIGEDVKYIDGYAFDQISLCAQNTSGDFPYVFYNSSQENWNKISISIRNDELVNAKIHYNSQGHTLIPSYEAPTCTDRGFNGYKCSVCNRKICLDGTYYLYPMSYDNGESDIPALGHDFSDNAQYCKRCGEKNPNYVEPTTAEPTSAPTTSSNNSNSTGTYTYTYTHYVYYNDDSTTESASKTTSKPKGAKLKKVKGSKKAIVLTWAKVKGVKGYQIQVATDKKFKKNKKTVTIKKQKTIKTTVKKLKSKKKYFVRIRTYKTVNGKKIYSSWSKAKTVKTK